MATSFKKLLRRWVERRCPKSLAKAISWDAFSLLLAIGIVWAITGDLWFASVLSALCQLAKALTIPIHEYIWRNITWGKEQ